jgi:hypothetical protein
MRYLKLCSVAIFAVISVSCGSKPADTVSNTPSSADMAGSQAKLPPPDGITTSMKRLDASNFANIDLIGTTANPLSSAEIMSKLSVSHSIPTKITGWGADIPAKALAAGAEILIDGKAYKTVYGSSRPDVGAWFKLPKLANSGFSFELPANSLTPGVHTMELRVLSADSNNYYGLGPFNLRAE